MEQYKVFTQNYQKQVQHSIDDHHQEQIGDDKKWQMSMFGQTYCFVYTPGRRDKKVVAEYVAGIVCDIVQKEVIGTFAKNYLKERKDLDEKDKVQIEKLFLMSQYLTQEEGVSYISYYLVYVPILKTIEEEHMINLDGWMRFRTKQYQTILKDLIEQVIYDYEIQKEYLEFLELLKETRQLHQSTEDVLHLVILQNGQMYILNQEMKEVTQPYIKKYSSKELEEVAVTREDLIMNVFILSSPQKVIIHNRGNKMKSFIDTLEVLFPNDISYCEGCLYCEELTRYQHIDPME
ncbi:MAG: sporulation protein YtxC [Cellulosilyticaceae bacterium]